MVTGTCNAITNETTLDDLIENPAKYGAPTLDEFRKHKAKYGSQYRPQHLLEMVDQGGQLIRKVVRKHIYKFGPYKTTKLEELDRILANEGVSLRSVEIRPSVILIGDPEKCDMLVEFVEKRGQLEIVR